MEVTGSSRRPCCPKNRLKTSFADASQSDAVRSRPGESHSDRTVRSAPQASVARREGGATRVGHAGVSVSPCGDCVSEDLVCVIQTEPASVGGLFVPKTMTRHDDELLGVARSVAVLSAAKAVQGVRAALRGGLRFEVLALAGVVGFVGNEVAAQVRLHAWSSSSSPTCSRSIVVLWTVFQESPRVTPNRGAAAAGQSWSR